jgi:dTDP-glucose 4,6-dehydratase
MMSRLLVTGGMGFIGSNFLRYVLSSDDTVTAVNLDKLGYGSNPSNLKDLENRKGYKFIKGSITDTQLVGRVCKDVDAVINFAAETHVDRSISTPNIFFENNAVGVLALLEACRGNDIAFLQVSTDEVYGSAQADVAFKEKDKLDPSSPYAASKAAADMLVQAYHKTYGLRTYITRCTNNFGPYQFPEKFIPKTIITALVGLSVPVYGSGKQVRDWLHVTDHCEAVYKVLREGEPGAIYNISGSNQVENLAVASSILKLLGKDESLIQHVEDRPGHDFRYALDSGRIRAKLGWKPKHTFLDALRETVDWYVKNQAWWKPLVTDPKILSSAPWRERW